MSLWSLYLVRCSDKSLYTGITNDVGSRFAQHCEGGPKAAKYLRGRGPLELVFSTEVGDRSEASRMEYHVKKLSKAQKEQIISHGLSGVASLQDLTATATDATGTATASDATAAEE